MSNQKKVMTVISIIFVVSLLFLAGCLEQSQDETNAADDLKQGTNDTITVAAIVNGVNITDEEVNMTQQSSIQQGQQISKDQALEYLIDQEILLQKAKEEGYSLTDAEAESYMETILAQQNSTLKDYKLQLQQQGISYEDQLQYVKEESAKQNYKDDALEGRNFSVTNQEARDYYDTYKQENPDIPPFEDVKEDIISSLEQQKRQEAINSLIENLKEDADIQYIE